MYYQGLTPPLSLSSSVTHSSRNAHLHVFMKNTFKKKTNPVPTAPIIFNLISRNKQIDRKINTRNNVLVCHHSWVLQYLVYKCRNGLVPQYLAETFSNVSDKHEHHTRAQSRQNLILVKPKNIN